MPGHAPSPNAAASSADFEFAALREARNYRAALLRHFSPALHGSVIEVGAGVGQFTAEIKALPTLSRLVAVDL